jgi:hypothetical protein
MSKDTNTEIGVDTGAELANAHEAAHETAIAREAERDAKLDASVRRAAEQAFSGEARPKQDSDRSMEETLRATMAKIQARPEPLTMPPLHGSPTIEETLRAQEQWNKSSPDDRRVISHAHREVELMKHAAESFGLEVKSVADLAELRRIAGRDQQQQQASTAPSAVWSKLGVGDEIRGDAEGLARPERVCRPPR